jgi:hypothetical protein
LISWHCILSQYILQYDTFTNVILEVLFPLFPHTLRIRNFCQIFLLLKGMLLLTFTSSFQSEEE